MITKILLIAGCVWLFYTSPRTLRAQWQGEHHSRGPVARWVGLVVGHRRQRAWARAAPLLIAFLYVSVVLYVVDLCGFATGVTADVVAATWATGLGLVLCVAATGQPRRLVPPALRPAPSHRR